MNIQLLAYLVAPALLAVASFVGLKVVNRLVSPRNDAKTSAKDLVDRTV